ncbi:MAG: hypothetical protein VCB43_07420 [Myxococcota bacterium]
MIGSPISYAVDGQQYVAVAAARGGGLTAVLGRVFDQDNLPASGRLLVFRFDETVRGGRYESVGMPRFDAELNREQADAIHAYIIEQAHEDLQAREGNSVWRSIKQGLYSTLAWVLF